MIEWYKQDTSRVLNELVTDAQRGLEPAEAARRLAKNGPNELVERGARRPWQILWEQFTATMVLILIGAAALSAVLGEFKDAIAIGVIVVLFGLLGFIQEYRAEQAMAALRRLAVPLVRVLRGGVVQELSARELTPGDVLLLEAGNLVPADVRLLESVNLRIQEATLTGESEPVDKVVTPLDRPDLPLGDRRNMAYMGTVVTYGRGKAVVTATGMGSELGRIATLLQDVAGDQTPLQRRLDHLGKLLAGVGLSVAAVVFGLGLLRGEPLEQMLLTGVSIAVAIVPEGLPAVVTITLALGAQRMLKRKALIRKLPAVETLGSVTVICSDKTGTLTENRMTVTVMDVAGHRLEVSESMRGRMPSLEHGEGQPEELANLPEAIPLLLVGGALCNDAVLSPAGEGGRFTTLGDPTEGALLIAAAQSGLIKAEMEKWFPRQAELPFDSERKRMTTLHQLNLADEETAAPAMRGLLARLARAGTAQVALEDGSSMEAAPAGIAFTKGAVDGMLEVSSQIWVNGQIEPLDETWRERILAANEGLAKGGMRVLGVAMRFWPDGAAPSAQELESDLVVVGLFGMIDPPRPEVKLAVQTSQAAGIRTVMITGDHPLTARQIAGELGISSGQVLTGRDLARLSPDELRALVDDVSVYARVSPENKLQIVQALQERGHIVAMTGDGVNDAPALKRADIGVAMGITGTDVTKEAAEMVLQDDNFATIIAAIEEGRTIFDNLRKFIKYSVAGNIGKVAVMLLAPLLGKPLPLIPLQLLWLNLLTDGLLGLGLGVEPPEKNIMRRPPFSPKEGIFSQGLGRHVLWVGALIGGSALAVGYLLWRQNPDGNWQTVVFTTLAFAQLGQALAARSTRESFFSLGLFSNLPGLALALVVFALQLAVVYVPFLQNFFQTQPLNLTDLSISLGVGALVFGAIEVEKWFLRRAT